MLAKLTIWTVLIIAIATRRSSGMTAKEIMDIAYNHTIGGAVSLKFMLWRAANCENENIIVTDRLSESCYACTCDSSVTKNCDDTPCPNNFLNDRATGDFWNNRTLIKPWLDISHARPFQLYKVDDGYCYVTEIDASTGRTMKCFVNRNID